MRKLMLLTGDDEGGMLMGVRCDRCRHWLPPEPGDPRGDHGPNGCWEIAELIQGELAWHPLTVPDGFGCALFEAKEGT